MKDRSRLFEGYLFNLKVHKIIQMLMYCKNFINDTKIYFLQKGNIFFQRSKIMLFFLK